jgi:hypothetical protein
MAVAQGTTLVTNLATGQKFDSTDYVINTVTGGITGAASGLIGGADAVVRGIRVGLGALGAGVASEISDAAHGRPVDVEKAQKVGLLSVAFGAVTDKLSTEITGPSSPWQPHPNTQLAKEWAMIQTRIVRTLTALDTLANQLPLNIINTLAEPE